MSEARPWSSVLHAELGAWSVRALERWVAEAEARWAGRQCVGSGSGSASETPGFEWCLCHLPVHAARPWRTPGSPEEVMSGQPQPRPPRESVGLATRQLLPPGRLADATQLTPEVSTRQVSMFQLEHQPQRCCLSSNCGSVGQEGDNATGAPGQGRSPVWRKLFLTAMGSLLKQNMVLVCG